MLELETVVMSGSRVSRQQNSISLYRHVALNNREEHG